MTKRPKFYDVGGIKVEIGPPVSTDGGLVVVARQVRGSAWFKGLAVVLRTTIAGFEGQRFGFVGEEKLSRTLLALICGFATGYRSGKEIADVVEADKLWRKVLGSRVPQIDLSRLVCVLAEVGVDPLRVALWASASEGLPALRLDGDSSLLELHGKQEGGAFNGHDKGFGYHAGWILEASGRLAACGSTKATPTRRRDRLRRWTGCFRRGFGSGPTEGRRSGGSGISSPPSSPHSAMRR